MPNTRPRFPLLHVAEPRIRLLHFTWLAFFITFLIWFAHVSLMPTIASSMQLTRRPTDALELGLTEQQPRSYASA